MKSIVATLFSPRRFLKKTFRKGFFLIEVLVGISLFTIILLSAISVAQNSFRLHRVALRKTQAGFLTMEASERMRVFRDEGWVLIGTLPTETPFFIVYDEPTNTWIGTFSGSYIDGIFWREVTVFDVFRDANDDIITSGGGGVLDTETRKVRIETSWRSGSGVSTSTHAIEFYLTNI